MIAVLYFGLRLKLLWRILRRLGVVVSMLLAAFMFLALYVLIKTNYSWIMPLPSFYACYAIITNVRTKTFCRSKLNVLLYSSWLNIY